MKPLLLVMRPRLIEASISAITQLDVDKAWLCNYTEHQLESVIPRVLGECDHDPIGIISDDGLPTNDTLRLVLDAYEPTSVYTGYCNLDTESGLVNLSVEPLIIKREATPDCYSMPTREAIESHSDSLIRSWFAGFSLTFMSRAMWNTYPFDAIGEPGVQSDYSLCCRLQQDDVPVWAVRGAFMRHLKGPDLTTNAIDGGALRVGIDPAEVVWSLA